jgi:hypothetical protein
MLRDFSLLFTQDYAMHRYCSLVVLAAIIGCGGGGAGSTASDPTKLLGKLGGASVDEVALFKTVGADDKQRDAAFDKVMSKGTTVSEKIAVCRETPGGIPAELNLAQPVEVGKPEEVFGPPGAKKRKNYAVAMKELDFYTYGPLEVGMDGTKALVVVVNK